MFIAFKTINVLRLLLNILTGFLFFDYFKMQGSSTADETPVFAGLLFILVPTVVLWIIELIILSRYRQQKKKYYLSILSNSHFITMLFLGYAIGGLFQLLGVTVTGTGLMIVNFCFFIIATIANIYMLFYVKKSSLRADKQEIMY